VGLTSKERQSAMKKQAEEGYRCPCCSFWTLERKPPGTFEICCVCFWEDCPVQFKDPDYTGGANRPSLRQAKANFKAFGASETRFLDKVRPPTPEERWGPHGAAHLD
jgi:hypothetical protein